VDEKRIEISKSSFLSASSDRTVHIWNAITGQIINVLAHTEQLNSATYSIDSTQILTSSEDKTIRIWDTVLGTIIHQIKILKEVI